MTQLSYSILSVKKDCDYCFWLDRKYKISRPQGIKSGMPTAVDNHLKEGLAKYRGSLPPVLAAEPRLKGFQLYDGPDMKKMRHWKSNPMKMVDEKGNIIVGAFDDLLHNPTTDVYAYLDYKTTGKPATQEFGEKYYQLQCDIYTNFLKRDGRKVADFGVLLFFWPIPNALGGVDFASLPIFLTPHPAIAEDAFLKAVRCLEADLAPPSNPDCEYCKFYAERKAHEEATVR